MNNSLRHVKKVHLPVGSHLIADVWGCSFDILDNLLLLKDACESACKISGAKMIETTTHKFQPQGVSVIVQLEESHITLHAYPEHGVAFIDIFTCGTKSRPYLAYEYISKVLKPRGASIREIKRGLEME